MRPTGGWGYQSDTEILFPLRVAAELGDLRGDRWHALVERVCGDAEASLDQLAFSLVMIRLSGCLTCHTDCYRAVRGCTFCATQMVRRFRGTDEDLIRMFEQAREEVDLFLKSGESGMRPRQAPALEAGRE